MSISKAQAKALAEGFLDSIGMGKDQFRATETYTELILLAGELVEQIQQNLNDEDLVSTGKGSQSIVADEPVKSEGGARLDVYMNFYLQFHNKGVKGTRSGSSRAGFSFKNEIVSRKMYKAISDWIKRSGKSVRTIRNDKTGTYGQHETNRKSISNYDSAYAKARSIKMYGLKDTGFLDKAVSTVEQRIQDRLGKAFVVDVIDGLE